MLDFNFAGRQDEEPARKEIDFAGINEHGMANIKAILERYMPGGTFKGYEYICGGVTGGKGESCSTNIVSCIGREFADGARDGWNDPISLVEAATGLRGAEAAKDLADFLGVDAYKPGPAPERKVIQMPTADEKSANAQRMWGEGLPATSHAYTERKQVPLHASLRVHPSGVLMIPFFDEFGVLHSIQRIPADGGDKKCLGPVTGNFFTFDGDKSTIYIAEGYATAASVAMATGGMTVMCYSTTNMPHVAEKIVEMHPGSRIVFAADNDNNTDGSNPGVEAAAKSLKKIGKGKIITPPAEPGQKVDWNDYHVSHGLDAVRSILHPKGDKRALFIRVGDELGKPLLINYLIRKRIEYGTLNVIFGPSGEGKSFVAIDIACSIVTGMAWDGCRVMQKGKVLYLAGEGRDGMFRRVKAWCDAKGIAYGQMNDLLLSSKTLLMDGSNVDEIVAEVQVERVSAIFIDTLSRHLVGNENATEDMAKFIQAVDELRDRLGSTMMIVHHSGKGDQENARGSTALKAAADSEIRVMSGHLEWKKTKDMEPPEKVKFKLNVVEVGVDEDNEPVTTCTVYYGVRDEKHADGAMTDAESMGIKALVQASINSNLKRDGLYSAMHADWKDEFTKLRLQANPAEKKNTTNQAFTRVIEGLSAKKIVTSGANIYALVSDDMQEVIFNGISGR